MSIWNSRVAKGLGVLGAAASLASPSLDSHAEERNYGNLFPRYEQVYRMEEVPTPGFPNYREGMHDRGLPERQIALESENPLDEHDSLAKASRSATQAYGKVLDISGGDDSLIGRVGKAGISFAANAAAGGYVTHELAHEFDRFEDDGVMWVASGLNQNAFNSLLSYKEDLESLTYDEAMSYLINKYRKTAYIVGGPMFSEERKNDVEAYLEGLEENGIDLEKKDLLVQSLISDMSPFAVDCIRAITGYLMEGRHDTSAASLSLDGAEVYLPTMTHYLAPRGGVWDLLLPVRNEAGDMVFFSFSTDTDFIGGGDMDAKRLGLEYRGIGLGKGLELDLYGYLDTDSSLDWKGYSAGGRVWIPIGDDLRLSVEPQLNEDDLMQNDVKGLGEGFRVIVGLDHRF